MSGPSKSIMNSQKDLAGQQAGLASGFKDLSTKASGLADPLINIAQGNMPPSVKAPLDTSTGLLDNVIKHYSDIATGDNVSIQRALAPYEQDVTKQKQNRDQQIIAQTPRGGVQQLAMQQNEQQASSDIGRGRLETYNNAFPELEKLAGVEFGISQQQLQDILQAYGGAGQAYGLAGQELGGAESALTGASKSYDSVLQTQAQQKGAMMGLIGSLAGAGATVASAGITKCWIAAAIYGDFTPEFFAARRYIFDIWDGRIADVVRTLYLRYGQRLAKLVRRSRTMKALFKPLFDIAVERGR